MKTFIKDTLTSGSGRSSKRLSAYWCLIVGTLIAIFSLIAICCNLKVNTEYCKDLIEIFIGACGVLLGLTSIEKFKK